METLFEGLYNSLRATPEEYRYTVFLAVSAFFTGARDGERFGETAPAPVQDKRLVLPRATTPQEYEWLQKAARITYAHGWKPVVRIGVKGVALVPLMGDADQEYREHTPGVERIRRFWGV